MAIEAWILIKEPDLYGPENQRIAKIIGVNYSKRNDDLELNYKVVYPDGQIDYINVQECNEGKYYRVGSYEEILYYSGFCTKNPPKEKLKPIEEKPIKKSKIFGKWSTWTSIEIDDSDNIFTFIIAPSCPYDFRTNGKRIELKIGNTKASASCNDNDKFDLVKGLQLCFARLKVKKLLEAM